MSSKQNSFVLKKGLLFIFAVLIFQTTIFAKCVYKKPLQIKTQSVGNMLTWATAEEQNIDFFVIEKSTDGFEFDKIGDIKGAGYSKEMNSYRFLDFCLPSSRTYYRLLHYAPDGSYTISATFLLEQSSQNDVQIVTASSTITDTQMDLTLASKIDGPVIYEVKNAGGQTVFTGTFQLTKGNNELNINCKEFQNGKYNVVLRSANERDSIAIHKVKSNDVPKIEYLVSK